MDNKEKKTPEKRSVLKEFIATDANNIKDYLVFDVLIPSTKDAISNLITSGINMLLYGNAGARGRGNNRTDYSGISSNRVNLGRMVSGSNINRSYNHISTSTINNNTKSISNIDAYRKLDNIRDYVDDGNYDVISVASLYDECNKVDNSIDMRGLDVSSLNCYGWTAKEIREGACVRKDYDGYWYISLPQPRAINEMR